MTELSYTVCGVDDLFAAYENIMDNKYPISITKFTIPEMINFQLSSVLTHFDHRFSKELCNFNTQDNIAVIWNSNGIEIINSYFFADQQMHYPNKIGNSSNDSNEVPVFSTSARSTS